MLRPLLRVARPADWAGGLARLGVTVATLVLLVPVVLARLPEAWVALAGGSPLLVRGVLGAVVLWLMAWVRALVYARLPHAPWLLGRTLGLREGSRRLRLRVEDIAALHVELRPMPAREVFVVEFHDGSVHDLCPVHWSGAGRLYAKLAKRVKRAQRKRG